MSKVENRYGFQIESHEDLAAISNQTEKEFGRYLLSKKTYLVWYEPHKFLATNGEGAFQFATLPDFMIKNKKTGRVVYIEITEMRRDALPYDPKFKQRSVMKNADPEVAYVVYYGEQLLKMKEAYGLAFFSRNGNGRHKNGHGK